MRGALIQILLPAGGGAKAHGVTKEELTRAFGGLTRYMRAPAEGLWKKRGDVQRDTMVVYEVMAPRLKRPWWRRYRRRLEARFHQEEVVVRAHSLETL